MGIRALCFWTGRPGARASRRSGADLVGSLFGREIKIALKQAFLGGGCRGLLLPLCSADDGDHFQLCDGRGWNPKTLGVGAHVGWGQEKAFAGGEGEIVRGETFDEVAIGQVKAQEQSFCARAPGEGLAQEPFGMGGVAGVEIADIADPFEANCIQVQSFAIQREQFHHAIGEEVHGGQVSSEPVLGRLDGRVLGEHTDDRFFAADGHGRFCAETSSAKSGLLHGCDKIAAKIVQSGSQEIIIVLHWSFVTAPTSP